MSNPHDRQSEAEVEHHALPGDPDYGSEAPDDAAPPVTPVRQRGRLPLPVVVLGAVLALAIVVVGAFAVRTMMVRPAPVATPMGPEESPAPRITLPPRAGTPPPVQTASVGQRVRVDGLYGKGTVMVLDAQWSDRGDLPVAEGRKYLNLQLRYDCSEGSMFTSPNQYAAYDPRKNEYLPGIGSGRVPLGEQEVKAGTSLQGWVSIEMPPGPALLVISDEGINPLLIVEIPKP